MKGHRPGWPCWIELATPDSDVSKAFYSGLFGWGSYTLVIPDRADVEVFTLGSIGGPEVAGLQLLADPAQPASWMCFFRVEDVDGTLASALGAGGRDLIEPTDVANLGRTAVCADPEGADFTVIDLYDFHGASVVDEPSAPCWIELATRDVAAARRFYGQVFGWRPVDRDYYGSVYTEYKVDDGKSVAGMVLMDHRWPPDYHPHWMPYFEVADCDTSAARAADLGGRVHVPPTNIHPGRFAVLTDPTGARLGIITPDPTTRATFRLNP